MTKVYLNTAISFPGTGRLYRSRIIKMHFSFRYTFICGFDLMSLNFTNVTNQMILFGLLLQYILWNMDDEYGFFISALSRLNT